MNTLKNYYELCKPNVVLMMLITALVGSLLASKTLAPLSLIAFAMLGIGLCASSAAAINQIIDRKVDANMNRTEKRPIPQGEVSPINASIFALVLGVLGGRYFSCLCKYSNCTFNLSIPDWVRFYIHSIFKASNTSKYCYWWISRRSTALTWMDCCYQFDWSKCTTLSAHYFCVDSASFLGLSDS